MHTIRGRIIILLTFFLLFAACETQEIAPGPLEISLNVELPEPLSQEDIGVIVIPDSVKSVTGDVSVDVGSVFENLNDVMGIIIAIIPAVVSFDTIGTQPASELPPGHRNLQADDTITVSIYIGAMGLEDIFREELLGAVFTIDIDGTEVTDISGAVDLPQQIREVVLSGNMRLGITLLSSVRGRVSIESALLKFYIFHM